MAIGMTYDEFWLQDPHKVIAYRDAYEIKRRIQNEHAWLEGAYVYHALCAVAPAFALKPQQPSSYLEEPFPVSEEETKERELRDKAKKFFDMKARIEAKLNTRGGKNE